MELPAIDHLIYAVPDLDAGIEEIEARLGVRPVVGGRHPDYGTRNALLSLGPQTYLEIMAPDPELPRPERGRLFGLDDLERPSLATWVLREEEIDAAAQRARAAGVDLGPVTPGSRQNPDGTVLSWKLSDPWAERLGWTVPFLIAWGDTPHPAASAPKAGELEGLRIGHPKPEEVRKALAALGVEAEVGRGTPPRIVATIRTASGEVEIGSRPFVAAGRSGRSDIAERHEEILEAELGSPEPTNRK